MLYKKLCNKEPDDMKDNQLNNLDDEKKLPIRLDKTLAWLADSRNKWKEKCKETKLLLKRQTFAIKRLKDGRNSWKLSNATLKHELIQDKQKISYLQQRIDELESQIENYRNEIRLVKKKS
jgi:chromosome segregation ATPase